MASRFRRLRETSRVFIRCLSAEDYENCRPAISLRALSRVPRSNAWDRINRTILPTEFRSQRFSSASKLSIKSAIEFDICSFIKSILDQPEGPYHCWFNKFEGTKNLFKKDGIFLLLSGHFFGSSLSNGLETVILIEKIKLLQQRYLF